MDDALPACKAPPIEVGAAPRVVAERPGIPRPGTGLALAASARTTDPVHRHRTKGCGHEVRPDRLDHLRAGGLI